MYDSSEISRINKMICQKNPFYGIFLMNINKEFNNSFTDTACCAYDKKNSRLSLIINENFWKEFDSLGIVQGDLKRCGLLMHEALHLVFFHLSQHTEKYKNLDILNISMDLVVNQYINREMLPDGGTFLEEYNKIGYNLQPYMGFEYYYSRLINNADKMKNKGGGEYEVSGCGNDCDKTITVKTTNHNTGFSINSSVDSQDCESLIKMSLNTASNMSRGIIPGDIKEYVMSAIEYKKPKIEWFKVLRLFVGNSNRVVIKSSRMKLNRRVESFPGLKIKTKMKILVCIDTSGSVSEKDLESFWNEIHYIHSRGYSIDVLECDSEINSVKEFKFNTKPYCSGRGGTDYTPAIEYYNNNIRKYSCCIYFTDGECSAPDNYRKNSNLLWVISKNHSDSYKNLPGKTIAFE